MSPSLMTLPLWVLLNFRAHKEFQSAHLRRHCLVSAQKQLCRCFLIEPPIAYIFRSLRTENARESFVQLPSEKQFSAIRLNGGILKCRSRIFGQGNSNRRKSESQNPLTSPFGVNKADRQQSTANILSFSNDHEESKGLQFDHCTVLITIPHRSKESAEQNNLE